jgi:hypothetical protein
MDGVQLVIEALKFFENVQPGMDGMIATGTVLAAGTKASIYVIQKGAKMVSYLITPKKKETPGSRKPTLKSGQEGKVTKKDVAIVIDINHRTLTQVAEYLDSKKIDADFIVITNDPAYSDKIQMLNYKNQKEWEAILKDFASHMTKIQRAVGSARVHIFQSTPLALSFGLGCVWGTVHPGTIYHYEGGTYYPVLHVTRDWKTG